MGVRCKLRGGLYRHRYIERANRIPITRAPVLSFLGIPRNISNTLFLFLFALSNSLIALQFSHSSCIHARKWRESVAQPRIRGKNDKLQTHEHLSDIFKWLNAYFLSPLFFFTESCPPEGRSLPFLPYDLPTNCSKEILVPFNWRSAHSLKSSGLHAHKFFARLPSPVSDYVHGGSLACMHACVCVVEGGALGAAYAVARTHHRATTCVHRGKKFSFSLFRLPKRRFLPRK